MSAFVFGKSPPSRDLKQKVTAMAPLALPILIEGETGTGKETLAKHLHSLSPGGGEFLRLFCRALAPEVLARKLSGSVRGTLFLKQVNLLPSALQEQLLAALEDGLIVQEGCGGQASDLRLACGTSASLEQSVSSGEFLPDLYFRLSVCRIFLPPLRQRTQDIPELFSVMMVKFGAGNGAAAQAPPARLVEALKAYPWPGNLRELQNIARTYAITPDAEQIIAELGRRSQGLKLHLRQPDGRLSLREQVRTASRQLEAGIILRALESHRWNRRRAAETLKISYRALLYKMKNCNLRGEASVPPERMG